MGPGRRNSRVLAALTRARLRTSTLLQFPLAAMAKGWTSSETTLRSILMVFETVWEFLKYVFAPRRNMSTLSLSATRCMMRWRKSSELQAPRFFLTGKCTLSARGVTHEAGGCRMGDDHRTSVLDRWSRCHDVTNVLVVDAACFVSHPEKHTTHSIMALAYRAAITWQRSFV